MRYGGRDPSELIYGYFIPDKWAVDCLSHTYLSHARKLLIFHPRHGVCYCASRVSVIAFVGFKRFDQSDTTKSVQHS